MEMINSVGANQLVRTNYGCDHHQSSSSSSIVIIMNIRMIAMIILDIWIKHHDNLEHLGQNFAINVAQDSAASHLRHILEAITRWVWVMGMFAMMVLVMAK